MDHADKSVVIVDFRQSSATTKTLIDLDIPVQITKSVEPFFLDSK